MDLQTWGGGFIYHWEDNQVLLGFVTALDYKNPYISPYQEMQARHISSLLLLFRL